MDEFETQRRQMVAEQIAARGVRDKKVLQAIAKVQRENFVPDDVNELAYRDMPLPIAAGQTISQPYIVAYMIEALELQGGEKVLEIGTGSGYAAAVLAKIAAEVYTIERISELSDTAAKHLSHAGYTNVHTLNADGTMGWAKHALFDAILVSAGAPIVPESLKSQLVVGGRMVIPVGGDKRIQKLIKVTNHGEGQFDHEDLADVRFVPLFGEQGWEEEKVES